MWKINTHVVSASNTVTPLSHSFLIVTLVHKDKEPAKELDKNPRIQIIMEGRKIIYLVPRRYRKL